MITYKKRDVTGYVAAREAGCKCVGGKGMLLWQGVSAFKLYTGEDMPVEEVKKLYFS